MANRAATAPYTSALFGDASPTREARPATNVVALQPAPPVDHGPLARLEDVALTINGKRLVRGLSAEIPAHGITALMGANGAGKSLTLKLLHGLITPTDGKVSWATSIAHAEAPRQAMVFQRPVLLRRSVGANITFAMGPDRRPPWQRIARRQCPQRLAERDAALAEVGLATMADRAARRLSGGEQQRLALARALVTSPDVLLLDEPTANLDPASTAIIEQNLTHLAHRGMKIIIVTHDIAQARRIAGDVIFLHAGKALEHRPAPNFFSAPRSKAARAYLNGDLFVEDLA
ncbi:MAG: ATP-binding cassette domain-containing protein [Pseudomonadota bacterium]